MLLGWGVALSPEKHRPHRDITRYERTAWRQAPRITHATVSSPIVPNGTMNIDRRDPSGSTEQAATRPVWASVWVK
jgi:hypothetical protein